MFGSLRTVDSIDVRIVVEQWSVVGGSSLARELFRASGLAMTMSDIAICSPTRDQVNFGLSGKTHVNKIDMLSGILFHLSKRLDEIDLAC